MNEKRTEEKIEEKATKKETPEWKKKFSNIIGVFWRGGTYRREDNGPKTATCKIYNLNGGLLVSATGRSIKNGKWSAKGNAGRNAARALKKKLGKRIQWTDHEGNLNYKVEYE